MSKRKPRSTVLRTLIESLESKFHECGPSRNRLKRLLFLAVVGCGDFGGIKECLDRKGKSLSGKIEERLQASDNHLAKAFHAWRRYEAPQRFIDQTYAVKSSDWQWALSRYSELRKRCDIDRMLQSALHPQDCPGWLMSVQDDRCDVGVWVKDTAIQDILLTGAEAYSIPAEGRRKYSEIYGLCFGSLSTKETRERGKGVREEMALQVERVCVQHRARADTSSVTPNKRSEVLQLEMAQSLFPYWELLGDFHTHPYDTYDKIQEAQGWLWSDEDERENRDWTAGLKSARLRPKVGLILAISRARRARKAGRSPGDHIIRGNVCGHHVYLAAYRILVDGRYSDTNIKIHCPHLE